MRVRGGLVVRLRGGQTITNECESILCLVIAQEGIMMRIRNSSKRD